MRRRTAGTDAPVALKSPARHRCAKRAQHAPIAPRMKPKIANSTPSELLVPLGQVLFNACVDALESGDLAALQEKADIIRQSSSIDIDLNWKDADGDPALVCAVLAESVPVVSLPGIDVNAGDGQTPLHAACFKGNETLVRLLLKHPDIQVNKLNRFGMTPLDLAVLWQTDDTSIGTGALEALLDHDREIPRTVFARKCNKNISPFNGFFGFVKDLVRIKLQARGVAPAEIRLPSRLDSVYEIDASDDNDLRLIIAAMRDQPTEVRRCLGLQDVDPNALDHLMLRAACL